MNQITELLTAAAFALAQDRRADFPTLRAALDRAMSDGGLADAEHARAAGLAEKLAAAIQAGRPASTWLGSTARDAG